MRQTEFARRCDRTSHRRYPEKQIATDCCDSGNSSLRIGTDRGERPCRIHCPLSFVWPSVAKPALRGRVAAETVGRLTFAKQPREFHDRCNYRRRQVFDEVVTPHGDVHWGNEMRTDSSTPQLFVATSPIRDERQWSTDANHGLVMSGDSVNASTFATETHLSRSARPRFEWELDERARHALSELKRCLGMLLAYADLLRAFGEPIGNLPSVLMTAIHAVSRVDRDLNCIELLARVFEREVQQNIAIWTQPRTLR